MTDDLLKRATSALRDETAQPELRSGLTRARMLDSAAKAQAKRGNPLRWVVPFVLTLGASTALAHFTHQYFPEVWNAVVPAALERKLPDEEVVRRAAKPAKHVAAPAPMIAAPPVVQAPVAQAPESAAVEPEVAAPKPASTKRGHAPALAARETEQKHVLTVKPFQPEALATAESAELALFRRAQKLHTLKDPGAIAAWDDFLRIAPKSPLATEARYNRALGLIRAGRSDEARKALAPFAHGDMGGYRKREAAELIEALDDRDAGVRGR